MGSGRWGRGSSFAVLKAQPFPVGSLALCLAAVPAQCSTCCLAAVLLRHDGHRPYYLLSGTISPTLNVFSIRCLGHCVLLCHRKNTVLGEVTMTQPHDLSLQRLLAPSKSSDVPMHPEQLLQA